MDFLIFLTAICAAVLLFISSIAFLRAYDVFVMTRPVIISNFYIIPLILLMVEFNKFSIISLAKLLIIIALNLVMAQVLCYVIVKRALANKIVPDADFKEKL